MLFRSLTTQHQSETGGGPSPWGAGHSKQLTNHGPQGLGQPSTNTSSQPLSMIDQAGIVTNEHTLSIRLAGFNRVRRNNSSIHMNSTLETKHAYS